MNIYDIAQAAGVSIATVSRVLHGGVVKESTRQRILDIMEEKEYVPNVYAQGLSRQSVRIAGILVSDIDDMYYARAVAVLERELRAQGYDLILYSTGSDVGRAEGCLSLMMGRKIDGLFLIGSKFQKVPAAALDAVAAKIPVMAINADFGDKPIFSLLADDQAAMREVVLALAEKGHSGFLYLYDTQTPSGLCKREGFREGICLSGMQPDKQAEIYCPRDCREVRRIAAAHLRQAPCTAVIAAEDELAVGAVKAAFDCGKRIPQDIAVVGYDCSKLAVCCIPELSSVDNRVEDLCRQAVDVFFRARRGEKIQRRWIFPCRLVERETTGPAPSESV